jgi:hypothetical protein
VSASIAAPPRTAVAPALGSLLLAGSAATVAAAVATALVAAVGQLSFVPDVLADATVATTVFLMVTHVVAAAIVIPAVARRLS